MDIDIELWDNKTITSGLKNYLRWGGPACCRSAVVSRSPLWAGTLAQLVPSLAQLVHLRWTSTEWSQLRSVFWDLYVLVSNSKLCHSLWVLNNNFYFILDSDSGLHIFFYKTSQAELQIKKKKKQKLLPPYLRVICSCSPIVLTKY